MGDQPAALGCTFPGTGLVRLTVFDAVREGLGEAVVDEVTEGVGDGVTPDGLRCLGVDGGTGAMITDEVPETGNSTRRSGGDSCCQDQFRAVGRTACQA